MLKMKTLAFVMAGGEGSRLYPLTAERSKPSVPFAGRNRIVDFVLSNLANSRIYAVYLLVQYKSQPLIEHIRKAWLPSPLAQHFVTVVPPQMASGPEWFQGTADAVYQNLNLIEQHNPDLVLVFGADHIYRMDVRQMVQFHQERNADVTLAANPVPIADASSFGIIVADAGGRVREFQEKPEAPAPMPSDAARAYASMGNYIFNTDTLIEVLQAAHHEGKHDFGLHILPALTQEKRLFAYDFSTNRVPGVYDYEERNYWRDVGNIETFFAANQDVLGERPRFDLFNPEWPIYSSPYHGPTSTVIAGNIHNALLGSGTYINGASVRNSVVRREVVLEPDVELDECIIMDNVRIKRGARLRRVIVDRFNIIEEGAHIGFDPVADAQSYFVSPGGITVLPLGRVRRHIRAYMA